jgi:uncharacterized protein (DUF2384 family)
MISFHGQSLTLSRELCYLVADEETALALKKRPRTRVLSGEEQWKLALGNALDLFDAVGRGAEAYEWLVRPNRQIGGRRPLSLLEQGARKEALELVRDHLKGSATIKSKC